MEETPLDQRIVRVLTEARVVLPGAQALLGFQLAMVLMEPFSQLPRPAQFVHLGSLGFVLMAPAAYHRIVERGRDTERFHPFASRMVLLALALLGPGFSGDLYVVLQRAGYRHAALPAAIGSLLTFYAAWSGAMLLVRHRRRRAGTGIPRKRVPHRTARSTDLGNPFPRLLSADAPAR